MGSVFREFQNTQTQIRKNEAVKRIDYYRSEQNPYTLEAMAQWMANPETLNPLQINVVRKIVNNLATAYIKPAKRNIDGTERDQQLFADIQKQAALDMVLKQASKYAKLLKTALLRPVWRNDKLEIDLLTPDILDVVTGDSPRDLKKVMVTHYPESGKAEEITYSLWDADTFQRLDWRGSTIESQPNPYKVLPFTPCWDSLPIDSFWVQGGADLITAQDAINEKLTDLMYIIRQQGFGVGYIKSGDHGPTGMGILDTVRANPGSFVNLPSDPNAEIGFASPDAPIQGVWETIESIIQQTAIANGLSAHSVTAKVSDESGISKIVSNAELQEKRQDDIELWRRYEARLFDLIRIVWNTHNTRKFSDNAQFNIDFAEIRETSQEIEQSEKWQTLIDAGQASPVDWAIARNPDFSREDAVKHLEQIKQENQQFNMPTI